MTAALIVIYEFNQEATDRCAHLDLDGLGRDRLRLHCSTST